MKKLVLSLTMLLMGAMSSFAMTFGEAYEEFSKLPDLKGVMSGQIYDWFDGWLSALPIGDGAKIAYKEHQVGNSQTVYYGTSVYKIISELNEQDIILKAADEQSLIYIFATPSGKYSFDTLIIIDQAYQGRTIMVKCNLNNQMIKALKAGEVSFTPDHEIVVKVPILVCQ